MLAPATLHRLLDQLHDAVEPTDIAQSAVSAAAAWIPVRAWALVVIDLAGQATVLAEQHITPEMAVALPDVVSVVVRRRAMVSSARVGDDDRFSSPFGGSLLALPLESRDRCFGAIVGFDRAPSSRAPKLGAATARALARLVAPIASAIDKTLLLKRVEALSVTDDLTRLYNSRYLNQVLRRESKRAVRNGRPLSLLFIDLDGFKLINDTYGHLTGSQTLVEVAGVLKGSARETDIAARYGGDEFALILPDTGGTGALQVAERLCDRIASQTFLAASGFAIRLTASVGVATLPDAALSPEELVQAADSAMYAVKDRGKNGLQAAPARTDK